MTTRRKSTGPSPPENGSKYESKVSPNIKISARYTDRNVDEISVMDTVPLYFEQVKIEYMQNKKKINGEEREKVIELLTEIKRIVTK